MLKIRRTKTASGKTAIQVVQYINRKTKIVKHIGSAQSTYNIWQLEEEARKYIEKQYYGSLLNISTSPNLHTVGVKYTLMYQILNQKYELIFGEINNKLLKNLAIIRIVEPASKMQSLKLLERYFSKKHSLENLYRKLPDFLDLKNDVEKYAIKIAKEKLEFNFNFVLYDVTTLYFETFKSDDLRKIGFSKDNKFNQPQILIGLIVTKEGFPVSYQVFEGNKSEGKTLLPSIVDFKKKNNVKKITVIADAAMISLENIKNLKKLKINYIVGARLGNIESKTLEEVDKLKRIDNSKLRVKSKHGILLCHFSHKRYIKDKSDLKKQILKAEQNIKNPSKMTGRYKFVMKEGKDKFVLNTELIKKRKKLLGIKGYITDLENWKDDDILDRYRQLWQVEKSFRMAKSDLATRPIYHRNKYSIPAHILICFVALCVAKLMELDSDISIKKIVEILKSVVNTEIEVVQTGEIIHAPGKVTKEVEELIKTLGGWWDKVRTNIAGNFL